MQKHTQWKAIMGHDYYIYIPFTGIPFLWEFKKDLGLDHHSHSPPSSTG